MKIRGILQRDASDCGAACLAYIAAWYGRHENVSRIREWAGTGIHGTTVYGILQACEIMKMKGTALRCESQALQKLNYPLIAHLELENGSGHFIVVTEVTDKDMRIMDPATGKLCRRKKDWLCSRWTGVVITVERGTQFSTKKRKSMLSSLRSIMQSHWLALFASLACAMAYTITALSMSVYLQMIIDEVLASRNDYLLQIMTAAMLLLLMLLFVAGFLKGRLVLMVSRRIDLSLILGYLDHVFRLPKSFHDRMRSGEVISRIHDAGRINLFINDVLLHLVIDGLTLVLSLTLMFAYNWKLAITTALLLPLYILLFIWNDLANRKWQQKYLQSGAAFDSMVVQLLYNVSVIKQLALEHYAFKKIEGLFRKTVGIAGTIARRQILIQSMMDAGTRLAAIATVWTGSQMIFNDQLSAGEMVSFISMLAYFSTPALSMMSAGKQVRDAVISCNRLFEVMELDKEHLIENGAVRFCGDILFREVSFSYPDGSEIFDKISFSIKEGEITGICGEIGSGKTTLVSLLLMLHRPDSGSITIGDADIESVPLSMLRREIAAVPQSAMLFNATVKENICLDEFENYNEERLREAIERSGVETFCCDLVHGLDSQVVEQGVNFSGGQRQMIAIARALYRNSRYLVLDEPTASMDRAAEAIIMQTIEWYKKKGNTVIIISHSDTALKICDNIVILKKQPSVRL